MSGPAHTHAPSPARHGRVGRPHPGSATSMRSLAYRAVKPSYRLTKRARMARMAWHGGHPLVVFSVPKSASSTVADALRRTVKGRPVFQIHLLPPERVAASEQKYRVTDPDARVLSTSRPSPVPLAWPPHGCRPLGCRDLVRDPIAQLVSQFFQESQALGPGRDPVAVARSVEAFVDKRLPATLGWFDLELEPHVGIDVYAHSFDPTVGHTIIEVARARVLVLRTEDVSRSSGALGAFLGISEIPLGHENSARGKRYARSPRGDGRDSPEPTDARPRVLVEDRATFLPARGRSRRSAAPGYESPSRPPVRGPSVPANDRIEEAHQALTGAADDVRSRVGSFRPARPDVANRCSSVIRVEVPLLWKTV